MKWYLLFTSNADPLYKKFESKEDLELFAGKFLFDNKNNTDDNYIDCIIYGNPDYIGEFYKEVV